MKCRNFRQFLNPEFDYNPLKLNHYTSKHREDDCFTHLTLPLGEVAGEWVEVEVVVRDDMRVVGEETVNDEVVVECVR